MESVNEFAKIGKLRSESTVIKKVRSAGKKVIFTAKIVF